MCLSGVCVVRVRLGVVWCGLSFGFVWSPCGDRPDFDVFWFVSPRFLGSGGGSAVFAYCTERGGEKVREGGGPPAVTADHVGSVAQRVCALVEHAPRRRIVTVSDRWGV